MRVAAPQQLITLRPDVWVPHDGLGWRHSANVDTQINTGEREVHLLTDARGHRIGGTPSSGPLWRILALGDSFLAALQVEHESSFVHLIETGLEDALGVSGVVVNTGVGGWGPSQYLFEARNELAITHYDGVVVFVYLGNDIEEQITDHIPPRQPAKRHQFKIPRSTSRSDLIDALVFPINDYLEERSQLFVLAKNRMKFILMRIGLTRHYFPRVQLRSDEESTGWANTAQILKSIEAEAGNYGAASLFVLLPTPTQIDLQQTTKYAEALSLSEDAIDLDRPSRVLVPLLEERDLEVIDLTQAFRGAHSEKTEDLFGSVDNHLGIAGHRLVADQVLPRLVEILNRKKQDQRLSPNLQPPEYSQR